MAPMIERLAVRVTVTHWTGITRDEAQAILAEYAELQARCDVLADTVEGQEQQIAVRNAAIERVRRLVAYCKRDPAPHPDHDHLCPDDVLEVLNGQPAEKEEENG